MTPTEKEDARRYAMERMRERNEFLMRSEPQRQPAVSPKTPSEQPATQPEPIGSANHTKQRQ